MSIKINENSLHSGCNHARYGHHHYIPGIIQLPSAMEVYKWRYGVPSKVTVNLEEAPKAWEIQGHKPVCHIYYPGHWDATTVTRLIRNLLDSVEFDKTIDCMSSS